MGEAGGAPVKEWVSVWPGQVEDRSITGRHGVYTGSTRSQNRSTAQGSVKSKRNAESRKSKESDGFLKK